MTITVTSSVLVEQMINLIDRELKQFNSRSELVCDGINPDAIKPGNHSCDINGWFPDISFRDIRTIEAKLKSMGFSTYNGIAHEKFNSVSYSVGIFV